jgi:hypothetical protein
MAIQQNFPSSRPSLSLNFARSKKLDPRITFTRTSSATYVGEDGLIKIAPANAARFDHDPVTGESLGLLVEEQRTNLFLQSEDFSTGWGTLRASVTTNIIAAPDGSFTADKLTEDTTPSSTHLLTQGFVYTSGVTYTATFFVKAGERSQFQIRASTQATFPGDAIFNLSTGTATSLNGTSSIVPIENGWYRCSVTAAATANGTTGTGVYLRDGVSISYNGDGTSGIYIWGAQLEQASFPTSYIPTTSSTVTRTADNASITGTNFSSWYRQDQGSILWIGNVYTREIQAVCPYKITEGSSLRGIGVQFDTRSESYNTFFASRATSSNIPSKTAPAGTIPSGTKIKIAGAYEQGVGISAAFNGAGPAIEAGTTQTDIVFGTENQIDIGGSRCISGSNNKFTGVCEQLCYYPSRLTNTQLQTLTK